MEIIKAVASFIGLLCLSEIGILTSIVLFYIIRELVNRNGEK